MIKCPVISLLLFLFLATFCAGAASSPANAATTVLETEHIYVCWLYGPNVSGTRGLTSFLQKLGARKKGSLWTYTNASLQKAFVIHLVSDFAGMKQALYTEDAHVVINGHSNYGMGGVFATAAELGRQKIAAIRYIDDVRLLTYSSPWIAVNVPKIREHQSYPNWWPVFQDGTSGIMPYDFDDPRGLPPFNYCLTYQLPGDPTHYKIETVENSYLERFPGCDHPAWYAPDGSAPDPANPEHLQYFLTYTNKAFDYAGVWTKADSARSFYGDNFLYAPAGQGLNQVGWFFSIPAPGNYSISACWPAWSRNTSAAFYTVTHAAGTKTVKVNQKLNAGRWKKLGVFTFDTGEYAVVLTDQSSARQTFVVADAIRITSATDAAAFDQVVDNGPCPAPHFGKKTIVFRKQLEIEPSQLRYKRLYYDGCFSGPYYLGTFQRGISFYTVDDSEGTGYTSYLKAYLGGKTDEEIWAAVQQVQAVYDYFDFGKPPTDQGSAQAAPPLVETAPGSDETIDVAVLGQATAQQVFAKLEDEDMIGDEESSRDAVVAAFDRRRAEGVAAALERVVSPAVEATPARTRSRGRDLIVARRILAAFPDESVPRLLELYARGNAATKGDVVRAAGRVDRDSRALSLLRAALDDKSVCEELSPEAMGEPLRVCDLAYNQLVLRCGVKGVLRTIGPGHSVAVREYHINVLKSRL